MNIDLSKQFAKFAGKEVAVIETPYKHTFRDGTVYEGVNADLVETDPVVVDLKAAVAKAGFSLRLWMPGTMGTCDWQMSRLNVHVEKEQDGKYRIQPEFKLG